MKTMRVRTGKTLRGGKSAVPLQGRHPATARQQRMNDEHVGVASPKSRKRPPTTTAASTPAPMPAKAPIASANTKDYSVQVGKPVKPAKQIKPKLAKSQFAGKYVQYQDNRPKGLPGTYTKRPKGILSGGVQRATLSYNGQTRKVKHVDSGPGNQMTTTISGKMSGKQARAKLIAQRTGAAHLKEARQRRIGFNVAHQKLNPPKPPVAAAPIKAKRSARTSKIAPARKAEAGTKTPMVTSKGSKVKAVKK